MTPVEQTLSLALLHFIWQGFVGGVLLGVALVVLRKRSANSRYLASCTVLALLALAPVITSYFVYESSFSVAGTRSFQIDANIEKVVKGASTERVVSATFGDSESWILPIWSAGVLAFALRFAWAGGHASLLRHRGAAAEKSIQSMISDLAERTGIRRPVRALVSSFTEVPGVVGWIRPVILLPVAVVVGFTPQQLEALIAHELAHVRRHDYLVNIFQLVVETLLFYHPVVWWVSSRIRYEREFCCDDLAVRTCGDAVSYARALTRLERLRIAQPTLAMGSADGPLFHRIQRLLERNRIERGPSKLVCAIGLLVGMLSLGFFMNSARAEQEPVLSVAPVQPLTPPIVPAPLPAEPPQQVLMTPPAAPAKPKALEAIVPKAQTAGVLPLPQIPPVPPVAPAAPVPAAPPAPAVAPAPAAPPIPPAQIVPVAGVLQESAPREAEHWVLFKGGDVIVHGSSADEEEARAARRSLSGDLLWFKLDGKAYVSQDAGTLNRLQISRSGDVRGANTARELARARERQSEALTEQSRAALRDVQMSLRQLQERLRRIDRTAPNEESLNALQEQLKLGEAQTASLQARLAQAEAQLHIAEAQLQAQQASRQNAELESRQNLDILREAVRSGKAQPAPEK